MNKTILRTVGLAGLILMIGSWAIAQQSRSNLQSPLAQYSTAGGNFIVEQNDRAFANLQQVIELSLDKASVEQALIAIARKANLKLMYSKTSLPRDKHITLHKTFITVNDALWNVLEGTNLRFALSQNRQLVLLKMRQNDNKDHKAVQEVVTGRVTDVSTGETLPGVNIVLKGTTTGTSTDANGEYELTVPSLQDTLVFSFIGFQTREVPINGRSVINIAMELQAVVGEELVVVGYGTQQKKDVTGSVSSVSVEQIRDLSVSNFEQALKGQVAGVQVLQNSGSPSSGITVRIRGNGSITAGNEPLYVVDGIPVTGGSGGTGIIPGGGANPLNNINPNHIASIDILKDASATAIYGSRGANGVVLITTKSGTAGKNTFTLDVSAGWQTVAKKLDRLNAEEFAEYHIESRYNGWLRSGGDPDTPNGERGRFNVTDIYYNPSQWNPTDWQDVVLRTGMTQNYNLTASGGTQNVRYWVSGGYSENQGIIIESSMKRYDFRANIDATVNENLKIGFRLNPSYSIHEQVPAEGHFRESILGMALSAPPIVGPYQPDGSYTNLLALRGSGGLGGLGRVDNPVVHAKENQFDLNRGRILGNIYAEYQILNNLSFRTSFGIDGVFNRTNVFLSSKTGRRGSTPPSIPEGSATSSQKLNWLNENLLTYKQTFKGKHQLTAILGNSFQKNDYRNIRVDGDQYPGDNVPYVKAAGIVESGTAGRNQWSLISFYSRVNYAYDSRYLLTATIRQDGSSRFGAENKYGTFPSVALAWRMSEEQFMEPVDLISNLKWRVSYGVSGNNDIPNYAHIANVSNAGYVLGANQQAVNAIYQGSLSNPFLTWETNRSYNLGVDVGLFDNRLEITADVYKSVTDGLLLDVNIPAVSGFTSTYENIGEVENKGLELAVNSINILDPLYWNTTFNISFNRNKVLALGGSAGDFISTAITRTVVGKPMGLFYTRIADGIFNTQEEIDNHPPQDNNPRRGDRRFKDVNGDGVVNNADKDFAGNPHPDFTFGFSNSLSFKGFELNILINGSYGNKTFYNYALGANLNGNLNQDAGVIRATWESPEDPGSGKFPQPVYGFSTAAGGNSSWRVTDASFLRLTNITLAYNIPFSLANKAGFQNARIYISGQNLYTLTSYPGYDPEIGTSGGNTLIFGEDRGIYPLARVITTGITVTF